MARAIRYYGQFLCFNDTEMISKLFEKKIFPLESSAWLKAI